MRFLRVFFLIVPGLILPVIALAAGGSAVQPVRVQAVQADFSQEKHLKILVRPLISRGRFLFKAPDSLRWEYTSPFHSVLLMDKGRVRKFIEKNGRFVEDTGMRLDAMQVVMTEISGWLDGRFTDNAAFAVTRDGQAVRLVPKDKGMAVFISAIELKLSDRPGLLDSVTIHEGEGAFTRLIFSGAAFNPPIDAGLFAAP
ncbi:MAG TPA: outer membrane lipoprotein carrier protein LolA [Desulfobulbus sp.]|nr:outer membrane lipoprotein carrier protein LolA [Desulfobulbus sp.]HHD64387.1 outer membrane lipoprotein carrier protein LolA [Desulfobulbaceae bacterium]